MSEDPLLCGEQPGRGRGQRDGLRRPRVTRGRAGEPQGEVKSPQVRRRKALMFGSRTPNRRSMMRISDVWSSTSEHTRPPADHGENDDWPGPGSRARSAHRPTYSPRVPRDATGGGTWSNSPSFSS